jgi:hypothetical protein
MRTPATASLLLALASLAPDARAAEEVRYSTHVKPIFEERCASCHGADSPEYPEFSANKKRFVEESKGPRMDSYTYILHFIGWPDTGALMRRLDDGKRTKDGKPGNMYEHLGSTDAERQKNLAVFQRWIGEWTMKRWPEVKKEELGRMRVKY